MRNILLDKRGSEVSTCLGIATVSVLWYELVKKLRRA